MGKFRDTDKGFSKIVGTLRRLGRRTGLSIEVGFFDEENSKKAFFNEFGTGDIPERAFMRTAFDQHTRKYERIWRQELKDLTDGRGSPESAGIRLANEARTDLINSIRGWRTPPNTPETAREKGANNPLVDTGAMQRAITFRISRG